MNEMEADDLLLVLYEKKRSSQMVMSAQAFDFAEDVEGTEEKKGGENKKEV